MRIRFEPSNQVAQIFHPNRMKPPMSMTKIKLTTISTEEIVLPFKGFNMIQCFIASKGLNTIRRFSNNGFNVRQ